MASCINAFISFSILVFPFFSSFHLSSATNPHALVAPLIKDAVTHQYLTRFNQRTPSIPIHLVADLGGRHLWVDCETHYVSSTYRPVSCQSSLCSLAEAVGCGDCFNSPSPGCNNNTCGVNPNNPFPRTNTGGELAVDSLVLSSTDGFIVSYPVKDPSYLFSCAPAFLTAGLAAEAVGVAGLGRNHMAPPTQLSSWFGFRRKFAICLPSHSRASGVIFFGPGPYSFLPNIDASNLLLYTPLLTNPHCSAGICNEGEPSYEYFIGVSAIRFLGSNLPLNKTLLIIDKNTGFGGTKISTVEPYTVLETTIYRALTKAFSTALENVARAPAVAPFELCYKASSLSSTRVGPGVPAVDLVLHNKEVYWRIFGANSMVEAKEGTLCLAFIDGGISPITSIVIGGHQLEDNLVELDLEYSRVGFSSSLLFRQTTCSNFNFSGTS